MGRARPHCRELAEEQTPSGSATRELCCPVNERVLAGLSVRPGSPVRPAPLGPALARGPRALAKEKPA